MSEMRWKFDPDIKLSEMTEQDVLCPRCGYNLRELAAGNCPECGRPFTPEGLRASQVPWAHRRRMGLPLAFWRTLRMSKRQLTYEVCRRQDSRDARLFLLIVHAIAVICVFALCLICGQVFRVPESDVFVFGFMFLVAVASQASLLVHGGEMTQPDTTRAQDASNIVAYACRTLVWWPLAIVSLLAWFILGGLVEGEQVIIPVGLSFAVIPVFWIGRAAGVIASMRGSGWAGSILTRSAHLIAFWMLVGLAEFVAFWLWSSFL